VCGCACVGMHARVGVHMCGTGIITFMSTTLHISTVPATRAHSNSDLLLKHSRNC